MVSFKIISTDAPLRNGQLNLDRVTLKTPAVVPSLATLKYLTTGQLESIGIQTLFFDPLRLAMTMNNDIHNIVQIMAIQQALIATSGAETAYRFAKPRGRKKDGVNFHRPDNHQLVHYTPASARQLQVKLGATLGEQLSRDENYYAPVDDLVAATHQTVEWLKEIPLQSSLLAPIVGGGLKELRAKCLTMVPAGVIGYSIQQLADIDNDGELRRILQQIIPQLQPTKLRLARVGDSAANVMAALSVGIDVVQSDAALVAANQGIAWTDDRSLVLSKTHFKDDRRPISNSCPCPVCSRHYSRQSIHYLLGQSAPLATILLLEHNLAFQNVKIVRLQQAVSADQGATWVERYSG
ncbi:tRNA-guanine transglycosylase [Limosilactobacillus frumenti DSM 13145]|uniref:tRNA-guanine transglycosylase n=1 Tax=Limosilactobacillus frumenti DSM 13145 TaxID=1423746 RepID=A0A0R1P807_9LACO|nr:tRNA-guanine transglycosylase [Limosilactobacillus frumenti]KRL28589.1 tRNA-guanine transglycosylase [Limosilactobacillus frumenti DSM 13145]MBA2914499.1 tRNA-guanine transglycosylase [Limosilactobacillus frumenti]QFG72342.1 tRNA-guanine transglycosylase [Limosilactobacillus frumenti]